jgi:hypothetical protein
MLRGHSIVELLRVNTGACRLKKHVDDDGDGFISKKMFSWAKITS